MKVKLTKAEIKDFVQDAEEGSGREIEIGGDNFQVDITILKDEIPGHPELIGGTVRVFLNKYHRYIGHTVLGPKKNYIKQLEKAGQEKGYVLPVQVAQILAEKDTAKKD